MVIEERARFRACTRELTGSHLRSETPSAAGKDSFAVDEIHLVVYRNNPSNENSIPTSYISFIR